MLFRVEFQFDRFIVLRIRDQNLKFDWSWSWNIGKTPTLTVLLIRVTFALVRSCMSNFTSMDTHLPNGTNKRRNTAMSTKCWTFAALVPANLSVDQGRIWYEKNPCRILPCQTSLWSVCTFFRVKTTQLLPYLQLYHLMVAPPI